MTTTRRRFLQASLAAATAGAVPATVQAKPKRKIDDGTWPISCRDSLLLHSGEPDIWAAMHATDIDAAEVTLAPGGKLPRIGPKPDAHSIATPADVRKLAIEATKQGKQIAAFCHLSRYDDRTEEEISLTLLAARAAVELGVPVVRIDLVQHKIKDLDAFADFSIQVGKRLVEATKAMPVYFAVENHGGTTNRPEFLRKVFKGIGSKRFGLTMDMGNFYWFGHPLSKLYDIYTEFAPWTHHAHCKSISYPQADRERRREMGWRYRECRCPVYEGDIDYKRVVQILRKAGYSNTLCIDDESLGKYPEDQRRGILAKDAAFLRRVARP